MRQTEFRAKRGADHRRTLDQRWHQWRRKPAPSDDLPALVQLVIISVQDFCQCSATCIQNCMGFVPPIWKASAPGQLPGQVEPDEGVSFCSIADDEAAIGFGNLSCSS